jgi:hypothetical protein
MRHSHSSHLYPASHYDDQMCLKPPLMLWVAVFYLSRAITLPLVMALGHFAGVDARAITVFRGLWSVDFPRRLRGFGRSAVIDRSDSPGRDQ